MKKARKMMVSQLVAGIALVAFATAGPFVNTAVMAKEPEPVEIEVRHKDEPKEVELRHHNDDTLPEMEIEND